MTTFTHYNEPYGTVKFTVDRVEDVTYDGPKYMHGAIDSRWMRASKGWKRLFGTVIEGVERSRIFQHTSVRDLAGEKYMIEVPPRAFEDGSYRTVAM